MQEKIKGSLCHLGNAITRVGVRPDSRLTLAEWNAITDQLAESGMNTLFVDILEGLHYGSHPELAAPDAWTRQQM